MKYLKHFGLDKRGNIVYTQQGTENLSSGLVSNWCTGYRTPTIEHLSMLANYFGIDIIHFFLYDNQNLNELFEIIQKLEPKHQELLKKQAHTLYERNNKNIKR